MARHPSDVSELSIAAANLEEELRGFEHFAETVCREPLNSQKSIERVAKMLGTVGEVDERLSGNVRRLVEAIGKARERQQTQADAITQRAQEIQKRVAVLNGLMEEYAGLGRSAAEINEMVQGVAASRTNDPSEVAEQELGKMLARMGQWAEQAQKLVRRAHSEGFGDVERLADSLRQQFLAARNKAQLLLGKPMA